MPLIMCFILDKSKIQMEPTSPLSGLLPFIKSLPFSSIKDLRTAGIARTLAACLPVPLLTTLIFLYKEICIFVLKRILKSFMLPVIYFSSQFIILSIEKEKDKNSHQYLEAQICVWKLVILYSWTLPQFPKS